LGKKLTAHHTACADDYKVWWIDGVSDLKIFSNISFSFKKYEFKPMYYDLNNTI